jgi:ribonuclease HII
MCAAGMIRKSDPPHLEYERNIWEHGICHIAGLDEAGRGALAGPVAVGAVMLPADDQLLARRMACCRDSKQLTPRQRELCVPCIHESAVTWGVAFASTEEIDALGIVRATRLAATRALMALKPSPEFLLTDFRLELPENELPQTSLLKGDVYCLSIAAASVLAKTTRDQVMRDLDRDYPGYGWKQNKGYGTQAHRSALKRMGHSPAHRKSFSLKV